VHPEHDTRDVKRGGQISLHYSADRISRRRRVTGRSGSLLLSTKDAFLEMPAAAVLIETAHKDGLSTCCNFTTCVPLDSISSGFESVATHRPSSSSTEGV
jgi:hypothetical protein